MIQNCVICGTEFSKNTYNQIYCSKKCKGKSQNIHRILNCVICGTEFHKKDHSITCSKECAKKNHLTRQKNYERTPEARARKKALRSTPEGREKDLIYQKNRYQNNPEVRDKISKHTKEQTIQFKLEVFSHYSKEISDSDVPICACCKIDDIRFLTLDHIDGRKHLSKREQKLKTLVLWRHIKKIGFPKGYQILCYNCNIAKGTSLYCPHQLDRMNEK